MALVHLISRACRIQEQDRRVFDFLSLACIPFVVLCCKALTVELGRQYPGLRQKLSLCMSWVVFSLSFVGLVQYCC